MASYDIDKAPIWDQMQVFCKHISDHQIRLVLYFSNFLDESVLKDAVKITLENNPIASAKYIENKKEAIWQFSELNMDTIYSFQKCLVSEKIVKKTLLNQINTRTGPQIKISLIRSKEDILVINCDHSITDAAGVKDFVYQLSTNYNRIAQNKSVIKKDYIPKRSLKILSRRLSFTEKWAILKLALSNKRNAPTFQVKAEINNSQHPDFITHTISPDEFDTIKEFGKLYCATVNDMILAVYYFTLKKVLRNSNTTNRLSYSADLRSFLDAGSYDALSNFSAIHNIDIDNSINDFSSLVKSIANTTKIRKQKTYNLADFPLMAMLFKLMSYQKIKEIFHKEFDKIKNGETNASPGITNMGIISEDKITFNSITPKHAYMLGTVNHPNLLIAGVSTYKKHLTLSFGQYFNGSNNKTISDFIEELKKTINKEILLSPAAKTP